jgi:hypothetical protein
VVRGLTFDSLERESASATYFRVDWSITVASANAGAAAEAAAAAGEGRGRGGGGATPATEAFQMTSRTCPVAPEIRDQVVQTAMVAAHVWRMAKWPIYGKKAYFRYSLKRGRYIPRLSLFAG